MPRRKKFVVGWRGAIPPWGADWTVLPLDRLRESRGPCHEGTILILGPDALRRVAPSRIPGFIHFPYGFAVGLPGPGFLGRARTWADANVGLVPDEASLRSRLVSLDDLPARVIVPQDAWAPWGVHQDPVLVHAISVLPRCWRPDVENWCAELGVERHYLTRKFQKILRMEAHEVCLDFLCEYVLQERERKITWAMLAAALGFPDPRSLRRAVRRPRVPPALRAALRRAEVPDRPPHAPDGSHRVPD